MLRDIDRGVVKYLSSNEIEMLEGIKMVPKSSLALKINKLNIARYRVKCLSWLCWFAIEIARNNLLYTMLSYIFSQNNRTLSTIASKVNGTPKGVYLPISKLHSILAIANLLAHNNKSQICYCGQISLQSAAVNCSFSDNLTPLVVTFILLAMVQSP